MLRSVATRLVVLVALVAACSGDGPPAAPDRATPRRAAAPASSTSTMQPRLRCPELVPEPIVAVRFRDAGGACLPPGAALVYRCRRVSEIPVAVVFGRRYLGGPRSTPASAPAPGAAVTEVGRAADGTVLRLDAADPSGLLVTNHVGTTRWPIVPVHPTPVGGFAEGTARPQVFVVGDSVILGAQPALAAAFADWAFTMDAAVSRPTHEGLGVLRARRAEVADIVVVGLGYNDGADVTAWASAAGQLLDELAVIPLVVWVNLREARPYYVEDNAVLAQLAAARANVRIADWRSTSIAIPASEFAADGLHLRPAAADAMAGLVSTTVRSWYATQPDQGDQSCRPAIETAILARGS